MKKSVWLSIMLAVFCAVGFFNSGIAFADSKTGTISGAVSVVRTKVKTKGPKSYKNVVVYLEKVGDNDFEPPSEHPHLDQKGLVFIPHAIVIQKGTTVDFLNSDNDKHNVYFINDKSGESLDLGTWAPGETRSHTFNKTGNGPQVMITLCKLHLEMAAYIVILDNPFFTIVSVDGETQKAQYTIENVPPGKYQLNTWHKKLKLKGGSKEVIVEASKTTTLDVEITKAKYAKEKD